MSKLHLAGALLAAALLLPTSVLASEYYPAFLVLRYFVDGSEQQREDLAAAHREYYLAHGREAVSFRILDDSGRRIGRGSWMAFESEQAVRDFIAGDPYQRANLYRETSIEAANLYLLDKWFSIAPDWRSEDKLQAPHDRYDREVSARPVPPR